MGDCEVTDSREDMDVPDICPRLYPWESRPSSLVGTKISEARSSNLYIINCFLHQEIAIFRFIS